MTRFVRRKASTHARIVEAAERLMRDLGVYDVTIQDISDAVAELTAVLGEPRVSGPVALARF